MQCILGIDPGVGGGLAQLSGGQVVAVWPMPVFNVTKTKRRTDPDGLANLVRGLAPDHAFVELVGSRPGEGHAGAFSFGKSAGVIEGVLAGLGVARTLVTPAQWKFALRVPADKHGARARASQLFPAASTLWTLAKDDGKAEAALIALWGYRNGIASSSVEW
jgi:crossover junction endodeoxyribonuclease RuvC